VSRRAKWSLALVLAGLIYIASALAVGLSSPLFAMAFVALAVNELRVGHSKR
jgi:hypothetical protein